MFSKELISEIQNAKDENQTILDFVVTAVKDKIAASQSAVKVKRKKSHRKMCALDKERAREMAAQGTSAETVAAHLGFPLRTVLLHIGQSTEGKTVPERIVFEALARKGTETMSAIAKDLGVSQASLCRAVASCEAKLLMTK